MLGPASPPFSVPNHISMVWLSSLVIDTLMGIVPNTGFSKQPLLLPSIPMWTF